MEMVIEEYWEKVKDEGKDLTKVLKGDYELKSSVTYPNHGWDTIEAYRKSAKNRHGFLGEVQPGHFKYDRFTQWGIHSYQIVKFV